MAQMHFTEAASPNCVPMAKRGGNHSVVTNTQTIFLLQEFSCFYDFWGRVWARKPTLAVAGIESHLAIRYDGNT
ncbi:MAG: hypothetical protein ABSG84_04605 [Acidobacteriaceae bacterium]